MSDTSDTNSNKIEAERQLLVAAQEKGGIATTFAFLRLSGPGWLQSALTLGGGSLAGSLYLGVLAGYGLLWLQPLFMILGIIMLSAIGYVTMSTTERPFHAINRHVNPVLGWSWALASLMANMVWCLPQFSLANSVFEQNLLPGFFSDDTGVGAFNAKLIVSGAILVVTVLITWSYGSGHWGVKLYEWMLKLMVATIVICFAIVVYSLTTSGQLEWGTIAWGFVPDPTRLFHPSPAFSEILQKVPADYRDYWTQQIVAIQQDKMAAAAATAVGINMTFLFPYSILRKGWGKEFRGLQIFDLSTGMFIPFVLATSFVVIAAAAKFHAQPVPGLVVDATTAGENAPQPTGKELKDFVGIMTGRLKKEFGDDAFEQFASGKAEFAATAKIQPSELTEMSADEKKLLRATLGEEVFEQLASGESEFAAVAAALPGKVAKMSADAQKELKATLGAAAVKERIDQIPAADRTLAAMLVERDANRLSQALAPLAAAGDEGGSPSAGSQNKAANYLFGVGVVGMTLSSITLLMLISGFVICEVFNIRPTGWTFRLACLPAAVGVLGPFVWSKAGFALAVPTSIFGLMVLPIAYLTFLLLFNQRSLLKDQMPSGGRRIVWNLLMIVAAGVATASSVYMIWAKVKEKGLIAIGVLLGLALLVQIYRWVRGPREDEGVKAEPNKGEEGQIDAT